ncbi:MAG TPA: DUF1214 domain-containing protein [Myxococcota bacterium]|nr:DUF1214 domain-containing protein [Myxococcota bacterium]
MSQAEQERRIVDGSAWRDFCRALERAGETLLRPSTPATPFDRAEGIRYLTRLVRASLESQIEAGDSRHPRFYQLSNETIKIGNDNPDNIYHNCNVSGRHDYRIRGNLGTVPYLSFGTKAGSYDRDGEMWPTGQIDSRKMHIEPNGDFEILVSAKEQPGNWLPMLPESEMIIVRQTFNVRADETPARYDIECLDPGDDARADRLDPLALEPALERAANFVTRTSNLFIDWMEDYERHVNELPSDDQERCQRAGGDANIHYLQSYWRLGPEEALLVEADRIPAKGTWNLQLSNFWMESLDYLRHRIHVNKATAHYEPDGGLRIVIAHDDPGPGFPNWLETCGHDCGGMLFRWIESEGDHPPVRCRVVKLADLRAGAV